MNLTGYCRSFGMGGEMLDYAAEPICGVHGITITLDNNFTGGSPESSLPSINRAPLRAEDNLGPRLMGYLRSAVSGRIINYYDFIITAVVLCL
jgi:hypothetical protein